MPTIERIERFENLTVPPFANIYGTVTRDTTIVHAFDPFSLKCSAAVAASAVRHNYRNSPATAWTGFWWRLQAAEEPATDTVIASFSMSTADGNPGFIAYAPVPNAIYWYVGAGVSQNAVVTLGEWHWVEAILAAGAANQRFLGVSIDGTTRTEAEELGTFAGTTVAGVNIGNTDNFDTFTYRYANWHLGPATGTTNFLGIPPDGIPHRPNLSPLRWR